VLQHPTTVLTEAQRTEYFEKGYLLLTVYSSADSFSYNLALGRQPAYGRHHARPARPLCRLRHPSLQSAAGLARQL